MVNGILGKKIGMTQLYDEKGDVRPCTVLQAGPCVVTQRKTVTRDGYESAQIGLVEFVKESRLTGAMKGHFGKNNLPPGKRTARKSATKFWWISSRTKNSWTSPAPARDAALPA